VSLEYNAISSARMQCDVAVCLVLVLLGDAGGGGGGVECLLAPDIVIAEMADSCSSASQRGEHVCQCVRSRMLPLLLAILAGRLATALAV
jgi:hypothetical protein